MIKKLILCVPVWAITSGNAFALIGAGDLYTGCCRGTICDAYKADTECKPCSASTDCGDIPVFPTTCPDECPNSDWTLVDVGGFVAKSVPRYEARCLSSEACEYRCHSGSYGNPTSSSSGCTRCPNIGTSLLNFGASESGATKITDCYAPADTSYTDSTGKFEFTVDCKYSE